ncbi:hypothetical protein [Benzoatithermus flavus]|uniref:Uncharacterized protein n=1 Tax=Benzoatithermus flavus TaxID=3108223 RepID=A0ABU8XV54_9PROT
MARNAPGRMRTGIREMVDLQLAMAKLGFDLLATGAHAAGVIARRSAMLGAAMLQPARLADPEFVRMAAEKVEAASEAGRRAARHADKILPRSSTSTMMLAASGIALAESCLRPYHRRVRANSRRLGRRG